MMRTDFIRMMLVAVTAGWIGAMLPGAMLRSVQSLLKKRWQPLP
jgi:hypothetical protein